MSTAGTAPSRALDDLPVVPLLSAVLGFVGAVAITVVAILVGVAIVVGPQVAAGEAINERATFTAAMTMQILAYPPIVAWTLWAMTRNASLPQIGFRPLSRANVRVIAIGTTMLMVTTNAAENVVSHFVQGPIQPNLLPSDPSLGTIIATTLLAIVLAPVSEEILFRGLIFNALRKWQSVPWAAGTSGLLFALMHLQPLAVVPLTIAGVILAVVYARTRNIFASMLCHAALNTLGMVTVIAKVIGHHP